MEPILNQTSPAPAEMHLLESRQEGLLRLISELLAKNEQLRMRVAQLEELTAAAPGAMS